MPLTTYTQPSIDVDALQWLPDRSNTLEVLTQFFPAIQCCVTAGDASYIDITANNTVFRARPGDYFAWGGTFPRVFQRDTFESVFVNKATGTTPAEDAAAVVGP